MQSLACPDWWEKIQAGETPIPDLDINVARAKRAIDVFGKLRLPDQHGQPALRDVAAQWFFDTVAVIFGTVDDEGNRWVPEFFELVSKKNAKTTKGAGIMLTALLLNERPLGEFFLIGPTQAIAETAFKQAVGMIECDEYLSKLLHVKEYENRIVHRVTKASLEVLSFDPKVMTGKKPVGVLVDELHLLGKNRHAGRVIEQIRSGINVNPEGFLIFITTQSDEPPAGVFRDELDYARSVRDGERDGTTLAITYEFPIKMQMDENKPWADSTIWHLVHPNMGKSRNADVLKSDFAKQSAKGQESIDIWLSQNLNIEMGIVKSRSSWEGIEYWNLAADPEAITLDSLIERCEVIVLGIDGGGLDDLLGLAASGRDKATGDWLFWHKAWAHPEAIEKRQQNASAYENYVSDGDLVICQYPQQDIDELAAIAQKINDAGLLPEQAAIGLDPVGVAAIFDAFIEVGIEEAQMVAVPQGYRLSGVIKGYARRLKDGRLWHDGSKMMAWCVGNARKEHRGNATLITKQASGVAKIDPLLASFNAFSLMERSPAAPGSVNDYLMSLMVSNENN